MITPQFIKELVERKRNIEDLSVKSRKREYSDLRFLCFYLCRKFCSKRLYSLSKIGKEFNRDHASVIHGCYEIDKMLSSKTHQDIQSIYIECCKDIREVMTFKEAEQVLKTVEEIEIEYRIKHIAIVEKNHELINKLMRKIRNLQSREVFCEIAGLDDEKLNLMEERMNAFLIMNKN